MIKRLALALCLLTSAAWGQSLSPANPLLVSPVLIPTGPLLIAGASNANTPAELNVGCATSVALIVPYVSEGACIRMAGATINNTLSSGYIGGSFALASFNTSTLTATSATEYGSAATVRCSRPPIAGSNVTIDSDYCFYASNGDNFFQAGELGIGGPYSWPNRGNSGIYFDINAATFTDSTAYTSAGANTAASVVSAAIHSGVISTSGCANPCTSVVYPNASTLYLDGPPTADTNVTITSPWTVNSSSGNWRLNAGTLVTQGNMSATAWGRPGILLSILPATYTDTNSSGTVGQNYVSTLGIPTLAASSATTYTLSCTLCIRGPPAAGSNVTLTSAYGLDIDAGGALITGPLALTGAFSAPDWGQTGLLLTTPAATYTDTTSSGTVGSNYVSSFGIPTIAASSTSTFTNACTLCIRGAPVAGSNVTLTNAWSLFVFGGNSKLGGNLTVSGNITTGGGTVGLTGYTVSTLPANTAAGRATGALAYVTDAVACTNLATPTGGGSTFCPVIYTGSAWVGL